MTSSKLRDTGLTCTNEYREKLFRQNQTQKLEILLDEKTQNVSVWLGVEPSFYLTQANFV